jgi:hypothetical protein
MGFKIIENRIFFSWSNGNDLIVVERLDPERVSIACYGNGSQGGIPSVLPKDSPGWSYEATIIKR